MRTADTSSNENYFDVNTNGLERGSKEWYQSLKKAGFEYAFRWINSDDSWMWFATNEARAIEGAIQLYITEKGVDRTIAKEFYSEYVDIYSITEIIGEWF